MSHPDQETRVLAHRVFFSVLMPFLSQPSLDHKTGILSLLSWKVTNESFSIDEGTGEKENYATDGKTVRFYVIVS